MHRRSLLVAGAGAFAAVPFGANPGAAAPTGLKVLESYVTNREQFAQPDWPDEGTVMALRRDPARRFDPRSIQILDSHGSPLGYLPPSSAHVLAALMDHGLQAEAVAEKEGRLTVFLAV